jgi:hypothetical protein
MNYGAWVLAKQRSCVVAPIAPSLPAYIEIRISKVCPDPLNVIVVSLLKGVEPHWHPRRTTCSKPVASGALGSRGEVAKGLSGR